jgi:hypothetical protein
LNVLQSQWMLKLTRARLSWWMPFAELVRLGFTSSLLLNEVTMSQVRNSDGFKTAKAHESFSHSCHRIWWWNLPPRNALERG